MAGAYSAMSSVAHKTENSLVRCVMKTAVQSLCTLFTSAFFTLTVLAADFESPEILVLGDSQIPFGSGSAFFDFFSNLDKRCEGYGDSSDALDAFKDASVGVIGVRSTSLGSWTERHGEDKNHICVRDKKWGVNAGVYGVSRFEDKKYVQIGEGEAYQFCAAGESAFETMFRDDYYDPQLLVLSFLGNSAKGWAEDVELAVSDVNDMLAQTPSDIPCVFMTTQPAYKSKTVDLRLRAQQNLQRAFETAGQRCAFVPGATESTIASHQGNTAFFRLKEDGSVKDPFHPNVEAATRFFEDQTPAICHAVLNQLERPGLLPIAP